MGEPEWPLGQECYAACLGQRAPACLTMRSPTANDEYTQEATSTLISWPWSARIVNRCS